jgi:uncharacterized protein (TIGR02594 family)
MRIAEGELGQAEIPGAEHNPRIIEYHAMCTLKATDDETPWCSSFANWCVYHGGYVGTRRANARSWLDWGYALTQPTEGCVVVLQRGSSPTAGHVGFFMGDGRNGMIKLLGGNQGDRVSVAEFRRSDVLGFRWPKGLPV